MRSNVICHTIVGAMILWLATPAVFAQPTGEPGNPPAAVKEGHGGEWEKGLNLTPEQKEKLKQHREANKGKFQQLRQQMKEKHEALKAELDKATPDTGKISALTTDIKSLEGQMLDMHIDQVMFMKQTLTPEQYEKFRSKIKERREGRRGHEGKWGDRGEHREHMDDKDGGPE